MPVPPLSPNFSRRSILPSPLVSRRATTPPRAPRLLLTDTKRSPFCAATRWRAGPRLSATTAAQKPCGSEMPPLSGSHGGGGAARAVKTSRIAAPEEAANVDVTRGMRIIVLMLDAAQVPGASVQCGVLSGLRGLSGEIRRASASSHQAHEEEH